MLLKHAQLCTINTINSYLRQFHSPTAQWEAIALSLIALFVSSDLFYLTFPLHQVCTLSY